MLEPAIGKRCGRSVLPCDLVFERNGSAGQAVHGPLIVGARGTYEGERDGSQTELKNPMAQRGLIVVVTTRLGASNQVDLTSVESKGLVHAAKLRLPGLRGCEVGQLSIRAGAILEL